MKTLFILLAVLSSCAWAQNYPSDWWRPIPREEASSWETLPQDAKAGEVVLSKRTELGVFSNFAATTIELDGLTYASVEGLWQAMKYPDPSLPHDPRAKVRFPHTRDEVMQLTSFDAKKAGDEANAIYKKNGFKDISYGTKLFDYKDNASGSAFHLSILKRAFRAKLDQTPGLWELLLKTGCLKLIPDHAISPNDPPAYHHYKIYMELREERAPCSSR